MTMFNVFSKSILALTLVSAATAAHALSLASLLHLHPHLAGPKIQTGILTLENPNSFFRDVQVQNRVYTVFAHNRAVITAPVGTPVYAASNMFHKHSKGSLLTQVQQGDTKLAMD